MTLKRAIAAALLGSFISFALPTYAQEQTVSAKVGAALTTAVELSGKQNFVDANAQLKAALVLPELTEFEVFSIHRTLVGVAANAGDFTQAAASAEYLLASPLLKADEKVSVEKTALNAFIKLKAFGKAAAVLDSLTQAEPNNAQYASLKLKANYFADNHKKAVELGKQQAALQASKAGKPEQETLTIWADSCAKLDDGACYQEALTNLVKYYPSADYWSDLIYQHLEGGTFSGANEIYFYRLLRLSGAWKESGQFLDASDAFVKAGFPLEAKLALDKGVDLGLLPGAELSKAYKDKRQQVDGLVKADLAALSKALPAGSKSAKVILADGYNRVLAGNMSDGVALIETALTKPDANKGSARLDAGIALLAAGQKVQAKAQFELAKASPDMAVIADLYSLLDK